MSPNNGILFNSVLRPKLLNNSFASCFFINFDFLLLHKAHFDNNIVLQFSIFKTFESTFFQSTFFFFVFFLFFFCFFLQFKQYVNMFYNDLCLIYE